MSKKNKIAIISSICVIVLSIASAYAVKQIDLFGWGKAQKEILTSDASKQIVATVNDGKISLAKFKSYKEGLNNVSSQFTDEDILNKLIRQEVILQDAASRGITVSDKEVKAFNEERFAILDEDPEAYNIVKEYADGLGISMEEYKELSEEISKQALIANKYKEELRNEFFVNNTSGIYADATEEENSFEEYMDGYINTLIESADITISN